MRVIKPGKPWSCEVGCKHCRSQLRVGADSLEFFDARRASAGVGFTCPVCDAKSELASEIPPAVGEQIYRRKGFAMHKPEVIKRGRPRSFKILCGSCEAELLVEIEDLRLVPPDSLRTDCAACLSVIEIPHELVPSDVKATFFPKLSPEEEASLEDDPTDSGKEAPEEALAAVDEGAKTVLDNNSKTLVVL